jgi:hypothetical protein
LHPEGLFESLFYKFIEEFNKKIENTFPSKDQIPWREIPGYTVLLKSFLLRMRKSHKVQYWPEELKQASCTFMNNPNLLNPFVSTLYGKTRYILYK